MEKHNVTNMIKPFFDLIKEGFEKSEAIDTEFYRLAFIAAKTTTYAKEDESGNFHIECIFPKGTDHETEKKVKDLISNTYKVTMEQGEIISEKATDAQLNIFPNHIKDDFFGVHNDVSTKINELQKNRVKNVYGRAKNDKNISIATKDAGKGKEAPVIAFNRGYLNVTQNTTKESVFNAIAKTMSPDALKAMLGLYSLANEYNTTEIGSYEEPRQITELLKVLHPGSKNIRKTEYKQKAWDALELLNNTRIPIRETKGRDIIYRYVTLFDGGIITRKNRKTRKEHITGFYGTIMPEISQSQFAKNRYAHQYPKSVFTLSSYKDKAALNIAYYLYARSGQGKGRNMVQMSMKQLKETAGNEQNKMTEIRIKNQLNKLIDKGIIKNYKENPGGGITFTLFEKD